MIERLRRQAGSTNILESYVALMEAISKSSWVTGNRVTLLIDGPATYAAMTEAIQSATDHINLETYIFEDDEVGQRFAALLLKNRPKVCRSILSMIVSDV